MKTLIAKHLTPDSQTLATLKEQYTLNNIGKIIAVTGIGRILEELSKPPITDLQEDKTNSYYCTSY